MKGYVKKSKLESEELKRITQVNPFISIRAHARDLRVSHQTAQSAIKKWLKRAL
uniref:Uncharacterized protein n=1 Tax=Lepeophtheirus salmonis TaxID=72036 RepID=A0A0K2U7B8_LEPSM